MKLAAVCLLSAFAFQCSAEEPAHITVFREKSPGNRFLVTVVEQSVAMNRDWVHPRYPFEIYLDGTKAATWFYPGHFMTFTVPAGRHEVRTARSERIILDLKPGERAYIHPGVHSVPYITLLPGENIRQVASCEDVTTYVGDQILKPVKPKNVKFGEVAPENSLPSCDPQSLAKPLPKSDPAN